MPRTYNRLISREKAAEILECQPQTISNWVKEGILRGHKVGNNLLVDKSTILVVLDTAKDLAHTTEEIQRLRTAMFAYRRDLEIQLQFDYKRNELGLLNNLNCDALQAILAHFSSYVLTEYEFNVLSELIGDNSRTGSLERISQKYGISAERVRQIAVKAVRRIRVCRSHKSLRDENEALTKAVEELRHQVATLESENAKLAEARNVKMSIPSDISNIRLVSIDGISIRAYNLCRKAGLETLGDLAQCSRKELMNVYGSGKVTIRNLDKILKSYGIKFRGE